MEHHRRELTGYCYRVLGSGFEGYLFALLLGTLMVTAEFRHKTVTTSFLVTPHRPRFVGAKLLTAAKAGNPPDLAQVEYQVLPTLVSNNYLADISQYDGSLKSDFPAGNWNQVTLGSNALYGLPQDAAPMALFYRADLFKKYGLTVPTTLLTTADEVFE